MSPRQLGHQSISTSLMIKARVFDVNIKHTLKNMSQTGEHLFINIALCCHPCVIMFII